MKYFAVFLVNAVCIYAQSYDYTTSYAIESTTWNPVDPDLLEEAYALLEDVKLAVNTEITTATENISSYSEQIHEQFDFVTSNLAEKQVALEKLDNQSYICRNSHFLNSVCETLYPQASGLAKGVNTKWNVCHYNYIDRYDSNAKLVLDDIKNHTLVFNEFKEELDNASYNDRVLYVISEIVKSKKTLIQSIHELLSNFLVEEEQTLNKVYDCVFDGTATFVAEADTVVKIYCDCTELE